MFPKSSIRKPQSLLAGRCYRGILVCFEVALYRIENPVDELRGLKRREPPGNLQRFIYNNRLGRIRFVEKFVNCESQNIPINNGHALYAPVLGSLLYKIIYFVQVRNCAQGKVVRKVARDIIHILAERVPISTG